jgi:NAD(P)-dependent dehydrogenase (short-subunit alcohol dehydrogenase family)
MATVVVTGADRGIGLALASGYHARGDRAVAACLGDGHLPSESGIEAVADVDVTRRESFAALRQHLADAPVDVLICNAGIGGFDDWGTLDYDAMMRQYDVNALGPLRSVQELDRHLHRGAKIGIVTSRVGSIADNGSGGNYGYRMSKCAANALGVNLYHELRPRGIAVMLLHPGQVATDMTRGYEHLGDFITPETAASGLMAQLDGLSGDTPPEFRSRDGTLLPW